MGRALYRKYRSKKLSEVIGQDHITKTLERALKSGKISHAYLFTGPKGVGKTSIARILAHEVNNLPYDEEASHLDIIEIDAASNRRIDEIRELRDRVHTAPASAKYKVYIIDEVHMLTREAFNALLKTLEEPPAHVIFILATTEAHKLPETIVSRTQRFTFKPIEKSAAVGHLKNIAKSEGINISSEALELLAEHGEGSFRDSISLLDQIANAGDEISTKDVHALLGIAPEDTIRGLTRALAAGEAGTIAEYLKSLYDQGYQSVQIAKQLSNHLRSHLIAGENTLPAEQLRALLVQLLEVSMSHDPDSLLEIVLLTNRHIAPEQFKAPTIIQEVKAAEEPRVTVEKPKPKPQSTNQAVANPSSGSVDNQTWQEALKIIKNQHSTLYSLARMAVPDFTTGGLILRFSFPFHQKRLNEAKNKKVIADIIENLVGQPVNIDCVVDGSVKAPMPPPVGNEVNDTSLNTISNIFGPSEVLD